MARDNQNPITVLVTGGAGYVGSHSVFCLLEQDYRVVVVDCCNNFPSTSVDSNGNTLKMPESLRRVEELAGRTLEAFYSLDLVHDGQELDLLFRRYKIQAVIHFAALKSVSESISLPLEYYTNNLIGTINLLNTMKLHGCRQMIFSSSATVYGMPVYLPVDEMHRVGQQVLNPYGRTKCMIEQVLMDLCSSPNNQTNWNIVCLRYFNPVGAHPSGYIGEHTQGTPNNLMPYVAQVAIGKREKLFIFGKNFDTIDGTGVRDYIHIMDLAKGHTHALDYLLKKERQKITGFKAFNLGTGKGYSVLEVVKTFEEVNNVRVPVEFTDRRPGDAGEVFADASLALDELGWSAKYGLVDMCRDTYRWQSSYPEGYKVSSNGSKESSIERFQVEK